MLREGRGRYRVARIGRESVTLDPGLHTYSISYTVDGVLQPGDGAQPTQFYWNLIPGGWRQTIGAANLTVELPVAPGRSTAPSGRGRPLAAPPRPMAPRSPWSPGRCRPAPR